MIPSTERNLPWIEYPPVVLTRSQQTAKGLNKY